MTKKITVWKGDEIKFDRTLEIEGEKGIEKVKLEPIIVKVLKIKNDEVELEINHSSVTITEKPLL